MMLVTVTPTRMREEKMKAALKKKTKAMKKAMKVTRLRMKKKR